MFPPRARRTSPAVAPAAASARGRALVSRFHVVWMHLEPETKLKRKTICLPTENFKAPPILCPLQFQEPAGSWGPSHGTDVPTTLPVGDNPSPSLAKPACPSRRDLFGVTFWQARSSEGPCPRGMAPLPLLTCEQVGSAHHTRSPLSCPQDSQEGVRLWALGQPSPGHGLRQALRPLSVQGRRCNV